MTLQSFRWRQHDRTDWPGCDPIFPLVEQDRLKWSARFQHPRNGNLLAWGIKAWLEPSGFLWLFFVVSHSA